LQKPLGITETIPMAAVWSMPPPLQHQTDARRGRLESDPAPLPFFKRALPDNNTPEMPGIPILPKLQDAAGVCTRRHQCWQDSDRILEQLHKELKSVNLDW